VPPRLRPYWPIRPLRCPQKRGRPRREMAPRRSLLRDGLVDADAVEQSLSGDPAVGQAHLDHYVMQRRREPDPRGQVTVAAGALPDLRLDLAERKFHRLHADPAKARMVDAARRRDVELRLVLLGRREV